MAMLFSAGMGIGLMFWSVAEPMWHMNTGGGNLFATAGGTGAEATGAAAQAALATTFFHWGFHPWAIYGLVALGLGFFSFNRGLPLTFRSVFYPLLGDRIYGWPGHVIDLVTVFATLFGLGTSLGLGAQQISAGLWRPERDGHAGRRDRVRDADSDDFGRRRPQQGYQAAEPVECLRDDHLPGVHPGCRPHAVPP